MNIEQIKDQLEKIPNDYKIVALNKNQFFTLDFLAHWTFLVGYAFFFATMCVIGYSALKNKISIKETNARLVALEKTVEQINAQQSNFVAIAE